MNQSIFKVMVVDDNPRIHSDFAKIFKVSRKQDEFDALKDELFGRSKRSSQANVKQYNFCYFNSGEDAVKSVRESLKKREPYALAFIDIRMPGWDGIQTAQEIWNLDADIQVVLCTAHTDYTWESILDTLGPEQSFLILKKPFDVIEVKQLAHMLTSKWDLLLKERKSFQELGNALKAKDEFLARVSHEVRTPLHGIVGIVDLLKETELDNQQIEFVQTLSSCGESLGNIIDDILDFAAIEDGRFALKPDHFDFESFLNVLKKQFQFDSYSRGVELVFDIPSDLPKWIYGDETRITQIFGNILRNAFKFTPDGEITVLCKLLDTFDGCYHMDFTIKDTGVGIPDSFMKHLFVPFSQAENVDRRRFGGTGLGLAISKGLIESMGGSIRIFSQVGVGTQVGFDLFLEQGKEVLLDIEFANRKLTRIKKNYSVLAVDDSPTNRKVIKNQLFWLGYDCEIVDSGKEALNAIGRRDFDLILMDCQMPEMDGFESTRKIREIFPDYSKIPIVALSANIDKSTQEKCKNVGMDAFISKPAKKHEIDNIVRSMMELKY